MKMATHAYHRSPKQMFNFIPVLGWDNLDLLNGALSAGNTFSPVKQTPFLGEFLKASMYVFGRLFLGTEIWAKNICHIGIVAYVTGISEGIYALKVFLQ